MHMFEHFAEMKLIPEPGLYGDLFDGQRGGRQQIRGGLEFQFQKILLRRLAEMSAEKSVQSRRAQVQRFGKHGKPEGVGDVAAKQIHRLLEPEISAGSSVVRLAGGDDSRKFAQKLETESLNMNPGVRILVEKQIPQLKKTLQDRFRLRKMKTLSLNKPVQRQQMRQNRSAEPDRELPAESARTASQDAVFSAWNQIRVPRFEKRFLFSGDYKKFSLHNDLHGEQKIVLMFPEIVSAPDRMSDEIRPEKHCRCGVGIPCHGLPAALLFQKIIGGKFCHKRIEDKFLHNRGKLLHFRFPVTIASGTEKANSGEGN